MNRLSDYIAGEIGTVSNKGAGRDRMLELTSVGCAAMSIRCWRLAHEFRNFTAQTKTDAITDTVAH